MGRVPPYVPRPSRRRSQLKPYDGLLFDLDGTLRDSSAPRLKGVVPLYAGVAEGLARLARHYPLFIVSGCEEDDLQNFLVESDLGKFIRDWECYGRTGLEKWKNLVAVCKRNGLKHGIYVGDAEADEIASNKAGLPFFHVEYGHGSALKPVLSFSHFDEVRDFFLKCAV